ncbi:type II toxin-antitoxin system HicB family antitoxin [Halopenitus persicus]|uniref:Type II toxin-antitoxin system HicB family antitoxin n=1 Tax=Halopenitus persicus TaxID=1048396 RepID=A0A1H3JT76_9EURY|nr:HicB family protein [Halopenitus persicus]SDY42725.1 hypothetical protein SAMN05216564_105123 [Halopenitus persicus]
MASGREIRLIKDDEELWSAIDVATGVASCGETRLEALEMLDEAVALHTGEAGRPVTDDDLREWGLDPEPPDEEDVSDPPWFDTDEIPP